MLQPYDMEVGAGTFHPATTLRALGPTPWRTAYVQPSRRPTDGRYGENPNRLQHYYQYQVILKPCPGRRARPVLRLAARPSASSPPSTTCASSRTTGRSPTLGAWGLGWEVWLNGMEVTQFTYFQQVGGFECRPVPAEITYGLERLAMYIQGVDSVYDLTWVARRPTASSSPTATCSCATSASSPPTTSRSPTPTDAPPHLRRVRGRVARAPSRPGRRCPRTSYVLKCSHVFNLLDARGAIAVTERVSFILRIRTLAKGAAEAWAQTGGPAGGERHAARRQAAPLAAGPKGGEAS